MTWDRRICLEQASLEGPEGGADSLGFSFPCVELAVPAAKLTLVCTMKGEAGSVYGY